MLTISSGFAKDIMYSVRQVSGDAEISNVRASRGGGSAKKVPLVDKRRVPLVLFHRVFMSIPHLLHLFRCSVPFQLFGKICARTSSGIRSLDSLIPSALSLGVQI